MTRLEQRRQSSRYRQRHVRAQSKPTVGGMFAGNDYLSLSQHPDVIAAARQALTHWGAGSTGSPLLSGYCQEHWQLEEELADWLNVERVVLFNSGYAANHGVITTLIDTGRIHCDRLCHASLTDGILHSKKRFSRFTHNQLTAINAECGDWLVTEGTFSMDGDRVPAAELNAEAEQHKLNVILDDAHGLGVWNEQGVGSYADVRGCTRILTGTFGKAFGVAGAFAAGSNDDIDGLVQFCREYIYSTAFPPSQAAAIRASLAIIRSAEGEQRRRRLQKNIATVKQYMADNKMPTVPSESPIQTWLAGSDDDVMQIAAALRQQAIWVSAVRPPTVPEGTSRIRFSLQSDHTQDDLERLFSALEPLRAAPELHRTDT